MITKSQKCNIQANYFHIYPFKYKFSICIPTEHFWIDVIHVKGVSGLSNLKLKLYQMILIHSFSLGIHNFDSKLDI